MGVDLHSLRLLQYVSAREPLGDVATMGRQCVHVGPENQRKLLGISEKQPYGPYCEELLLERFGASSVVSFDASSYEHATVLHDMNLPINHAYQYDSIIDLGTLEHVFNLPVALSNVASLCKKGGRIVHALPANNFNGHGFWQFSPELFFSLYSSKNGFSETEVFVAELNDDRCWWRSSTPTGGERVEFTSTQRSYVLAITRKVEEITRQDVQQSDYVVNWSDKEIKTFPRRHSVRAAIYSSLIKIPLLWRYAETFGCPADTYKDSEYHRLSGANPHFQRLQIDELVRRST
jgi:hypothetical protein